MSRSIALPCVRGKLAGDLGILADCLVAAEACESPSVVDVGKSNDDAHYGIRCFGLWPSRRKYNCTVLAPPDFGNSIDCIRNDQRIGVAFAEVLDR